MNLILFLHGELRVELTAAEGPVVPTRYGLFRDVNEAWADSMYLGFFDWLRGASGSLQGVELTLHDGREQLRQLISPRNYVEWGSEYVVRVLFREGESLSGGEQEFSTSRCLLGPDGSVALLFDGTELNAADISGVSATSAQSSVTPDGSSSVAPEAGAPSSAPRVNAGIGPAPESDDGDDKNGQ